MRILPDGTVEGTPAECAEYSRLLAMGKSPAPIYTEPHETKPSDVWQPRPWPKEVGSGSFTNTGPLPMLFNGLV
jgi:hypothetical protein